MYGEKIMFKNLTLMSFALAAINAHAAAGIDNSMHAGTSSIVAQLANVLLVLDMVKLPIVLPIWP